MRRPTVRHIWRCSLSGTVPVILGLLFLVVPSILYSQGPGNTAWEHLQRGEAVALIRHADAPGTGDPPGFRLGDCSTQRNLSEKGRQQARRIGDFFRARGIPEAAVYTSQWCRCVDTARLLNLGPAKALASLNSFFEDPAAGASRTSSLRAFLSSPSRGTPTILVTHQVNITALTGVVPSPGEIIIFRPSEGTKGEALGRFTP